MPQSERRQAAADFAAELLSLTPIVEVEEIPRCAAMRTTTGCRELVGTPSPNRRERLATVFLMLGIQLPPVPGGPRRSDGGRLGQRSQGIDGEIAVVRGCKNNCVNGHRM